MNRKKKLSLGKKLLFTGILLLFPLILFVIFELFLRIVLPQPPRGFSDSLFTSRDGLTIVKPYIKGAQYSREFDVPVHGNRFGYRCGAWSKGLALDSELPKCVIVGDSFAFGWGVGGDEVFTNFLNDKFQYLDLGIPGDGPVQQYNRLKWAFDNVKNIKKALLLLYDNDMSEFNPEKGGNGRRSNRKPQPVPLMARVKDAVLKLHSVRLISRVIDKMGLSDSFASMFGFEQLRKRVIVKDIVIHKKDFHKSERWRWAEKVYKDIVELCTENGVELSVIRIVPVYFLELPLRKHYLDSYGIAETEYDFGQTGQRLSGIFSDYREFAPDSDGLYFKYDMHLNKKGHKALAEFMNNSVLID
ncbi:MAG: hypothetical protein GF401_00665 [Chitinivibrionales bacterium]|nr:hypothetical protein [Chitinivibrionales bacterium]